LVFFVRLCGLRAFVVAAANVACACRSAKAFALQAIEIGPTAIALRTSITNDRSGFARFVMI